MEIAAFAVGCLAVGLASLSLGWQVFTWRRERRFAVTAVIRSEGVGLGSRRYAARVVVTNEGGTVEWIEQVALHANYEREINRRMYFNSPELVRNPSLNRELPPRKRFESEFNLVSGQIGGGGLPKEVVAVISFASSREVRSEPFRPDRAQADAAFKDAPVADLRLSEAAIEDYLPVGPHAICPDCRSEIPSDARICRFCGFRLAQAPEREG
jgi:hypothetical protein